MGIKKVVADRLERARTFADRARDAYQEAYKKAVEASKESLDELVKAGENIEPKIRSAIGDGLHSAQATLDDFNQSLADKAIPACRRGAVSKEHLDQKARKVVKQEAKRSEVVEKVNEPIKKATKRTKSRSHASSAKGNAKAKK